MVSSMIVALKNGSSSTYDLPSWKVNVEVV